MAEQAKVGDQVQLTKKQGIFIDYETGFEVCNAQISKLENKIGKATNLAIQSGGLLIIKSKAKKSADIK